MHTTESGETQGVAGSVITGPKRKDVMDRIQTNGGETDCVPGVHSQPANEQELLGSCNRELFPVHEPNIDLKGFAPPEWHPSDYQERGVKWLSQKIGSALFLPPGFGKTSIVLAARNMVADRGRPARMLVFGPLTAIITTWMAEPKKWKQFAHLKIGLARGPDREAILMDRNYDIVITNYDSLEWAAPVLSRGHYFDILACDELTRLKHIQSKRFKLLKPLLSTFTFRWGMTGTPAANGLLDLFGQVFVLDLGQRLGRYITHFRAKYFYQKPWDQYRYYISDKVAEELIGTISDICMYMDPGEYLHLPPLLDVIRPCLLPPVATKQYKVLEEEFILALETGLVTAANAGVLTSKLRQFTGGAVYHPGGESYSHIHTSKIEALDDLVEELAGDPLMVAYQFEHEFERLIKEYPKALYIKGGMTKNQLTNTVETWNAGDTPILLVQPSAAALGLNLQFGGNNLCWFTLTYNLEEYIQLIARLLRRGQTKPVMNYILSMSGCIDAIVAKVLVEKDMTQNMLFKALQQIKK